MVGICGSENEYAISGAADLEATVRAVYDEYQKLGPVLKGLESGFWDESGRRVYIDSGHHLELGHWECASPYDVVLAEKSGERQIEAAVQAVNGRTRPGKIVALKNSLDYLGATYGSHESYAFHGAREQLEQGLTGHLCTRALYAGAGALSSDEAGSGFELAARARFVQQVAADVSTHDRPLHNRRLEPHSATWQRYHHLSGDALMSQTSIALKFGPTHLLVFLHNADRPVGHLYQPAEPVQALRATSLHGVEAQIRLGNGRVMSALEVQQAYHRDVGAALAHLPERQRPPWAEEMWELWGWALTALGSDNPSLYCTLDAHIKYVHFTRFLERRGLTWREWHDQSALLDQITGATGGKVNLWESLSQVSLAGADEEEVRSLRQFMSGRGLTFDPARQQVVYELRELDQKYHWVDQEHGLYYRLRAAGLIQDELFDEAAIQRARHEPTPGTRAVARSQAIRRLAGRPASCGWQKVVEYDADGDPVKTLSLEEEPTPTPPPPDRRSLLEEILQVLLEGDEAALRDFLARQEQRGGAVW